MIPDSPAGTVFGWYDFYLFGSLATIIGPRFFASSPQATNIVFGSSPSTCPGICWVRAGAPSAMAAHPDPRRFGTGKAKG